MKTIFFSDAHLREREDLSFKKVERFLRKLKKERVGRVCIVGDLFDLWVGNNGVAIESYRPIVDALESLAASGCLVHYFEGNHDFFLGDYFGGMPGFVIHPRPGPLELEGIKAFVTHGDEINRTDYKYRALKALLRNPLTHLLSRIVPDAAVWKIGGSLSGRSRGGWYHVTDSAPAFRSFARDRFREGYELVVCGHSHVPELAQEPGGKTYVNLGDWMTHFTYVEQEGKRVRLLRFED